MLPRTVPITPHPPVKPVASPLYAIHSACCEGNILNTIFYFYFIIISALTLLVGRQEGHPACKNLSDGILAWLPGMRCRLAYSPADATATHYLLLQ